MRGSTALKGFPPVALQGPASREAHTCAQLSAVTVQLSAAPASLDQARALDPAVPYAHEPAAACALDPAVVRVLGVTGNREVESLVIAAAECGPGHCRKQRRAGPLLPAALPLLQFC